MPEYARAHWLLLAAFFVVLAWSAFGPSDATIWALEVAPGVIGVSILVATAKRFQFTSLAYVMVFVHCVILFVGAKYTYAEVPFFEWLRVACDLGRNNYDKVGHFAQGFIPALVTREVFIRFDIVRGRGWCHFCVICVCLAASAMYEIFEWIAAVALGEDAESFLGTQGYEWDTQSDMLCAFLGACAMLILLSRMHDRAMTRMPKRLVYASV